MNQQYMHFIEIEGLVAMISIFHFFLFQCNFSVLELLFFFVNELIERHLLLRITVSYRCGQGALAKSDSQSINVHVFCWVHVRKLP